MCYILPSSRGILNPIKINRTVALHERFNLPGKSQYSIYSKIEKDGIFGYFYF